MPELDLGFEGGGLVRCAVSEDEAATLERAYRGTEQGPVAVVTDRGTLMVDLRRVVYLRRVDIRRTIGFAER